MTRPSIKNTRVIEGDYLPGYVCLVITIQFLFANEEIRLVPAENTIYLHGHDFVIFEQISGEYSLTKSAKTFSINSPGWSDITLLPAGGYLVIA